MSSDTKRPSDWAVMTSCEIESLAQNEQSVPGSKSGRSEKSLLAFLSGGAYFLGLIQLTLGLCSAASASSLRATLLAVSDVRMYSSRVSAIRSSQMEDKARELLQLRNARGFARNAHQHALQASSI